MNRVFGFVDVQNDFMNVDGLLYVPNAETIKNNIGKLVKFAEDRNCPIFCTQDRHNNDDPEMNTVGGQFPLHCLVDSVGANNIKEFVTKKPLVSFGKRCYNVFDPKLGNNEIKKYLIDMGTTEVWLAGVATDFCIRAAALGLRKMGIDVYIFENAIMGVAEDTTEAAIVEMRKAGCHFVKCSL